MKPRLETPPRLLIVSGTAPGKGHVGELILSDVVSAFPRGHCAVLSTRAPQQADKSLDGQYHLQVLDQSAAKPQSRREKPLGRIGRLLGNLVGIRKATSMIIDEAAAVAERLSADKVWLVLDSPEMIAVGPMLARRLSLPFVSLVWDPPAHLLQSPRLDRFTRRSLLARFSETLALSERVAVVSENMAEDYTRDHGATTILVRRGVVWSGPGRKRESGLGDEFVIGFAGALHAKSAWDAWVAALDQLQWRVGGRRIRMRILGPSLQVSSRSSALIEYLGWRDDAEASEILAACDATYLPFPFEPKLADMARYSFPTKLSAYIALGLPILAHAPPESSVASFMREHQLGASCTTLSAQDIVEALTKIVNGPWPGFEQRCRSVHDAHFSRAQFINSLAEFVGCSSEALI